MADTMTPKQIRRLVDALHAGNAPRGSRVAEELAASVLERVTNAWPGVVVDVEAFFAHLGRLLADEAWNSVPALAYEDLYLAFACGSGEKTALGIFGREYGPDLETAAARMRLTPERTEDVRQQLWQKLFVGQDGSPRILKRCKLLFCVWI